MPSRYGYNETGGVHRVTRGSYSMRPKQVSTILATVMRMTGELPDVYLFGSRLDDRKRGGDVDLIVATSRRQSLLQRARLKLAIEEATQLPCDVTVMARKGASTPFERLARWD